MLSAAWLLAIGTTIQVVVSGSIVPPVFDYDNLTLCRERYSADAVFCYVKVITKVDDPFRSAQHDSTRIVQQFRRNLLEHAICVQDCEREVAELSEEERDRLYCEEFPVNFRHFHSTCHWQEQLEPYVKRYSKLINICVNNRLERRYNLPYHGHSKIEYCLDRKLLQDGEPYDALKLIFLTISSALFITLLYANLCDLFGKNRANLIVSAFSLRRTWANFTEESKSDLYKDFAYIDGLRVVINFIVLYGHCVMVPTNMPIDNPEDLEQFSMLLSTRYQASSFAYPVKVFFTISGLLLTVNFLRDVKRNPSLEPGYFRSKIVNRLIRLLPVYYFFLLAATVGPILPGVNLGLLGYKALVREQQMCRSNWWTNVLMINNLPFYDDECFGHGWYLGADLQLFLLGLLVLFMIWKFPQICKVLFWGLAIISIVIPAVISYRNRITSILASDHGQTPFLFMYDKFLREIYQPSYCNINSFLGGMIAGYLYHKCKHDKLDLSKSKLYNLMQKIATPLVILALLPVNLFFTYNIPRWGVLLHSILHRNVIVLVACLGYIKCFQSPKGLPRRILSSRIMTTAGKLSYSSYVLHTAMIRYIVNASPGLYHFSEGGVAAMTLATVALTYAVSVPVYLTIEQPVSTVLKSWYFGNKKLKEA